MTQLHFRYGTMNSAKTASLLMMAYTYESKQNHDNRVCVMKPMLDTRFGSDYVASRAGLRRKADVLLSPSAPAACVEQAFEEFELRSSMPTAVVLVDECQFLSVADVEALRRIALRVNVFCYGLRTDYRGYFFPGSRRLMELADTIEEIKTTCTSCAHKAVITAKFFVNNTGEHQFIAEGSDEPDLGAEDKYTALCYACWHARTRQVPMPTAATAATAAPARASGGVDDPDTPGTCSDL